MTGDLRTGELGTVTTVRVVLVHSPITAADLWAPVAELLRARAVEVTVPRVIEAPRTEIYWSSHVQAVLDALIMPPEETSALVLVLHSGAGPLADQLVTLLDEAGHAVEGVIFADADLPAGGRSRLSLWRMSDPEGANAVNDLLNQGLRYPRWTDAQVRPLLSNGAVRRRFLDGMQPMDEAYWREHIPEVRAPAHRRAVLSFSDGYPVTVAAAQQHGWPLLELGAENHLLPLEDPPVVAEAVLEIIDHLLDDHAQAARSGR